MALKAMKPPERRGRGSKYDPDPGDVKVAKEMLAKGERPGEVGYESENQARTAAKALANACGSDIGTSVWKADNGKWSYCVQPGKRQFKPKEDPNQESLKTS